MKSISKVLVAITILLSFTSCNAQIKNAKTETVKIYGNCGMCEKTIEKAARIVAASKIEINLRVRRNRGNDYYNVNCISVLNMPVVVMIAVEIIYQ